MDSGYMRCQGCGCLSDSCYCNKTNRRRYMCVIVLEARENIRMQEFIDYFLDFYDPSGPYPDRFPKPVTREDVREAVNVRRKHQKEYSWGGDSTDRELVRDILLYQQGVSIDDLEFNIVTGWIS